jgi:AraC-like DNA-binding protein
MPVVTSTSLTPYVQGETLSDALFTPMGILKRVRYAAELEIVPHNHGSSGQFLLVLEGETHFGEPGLSHFVCPPGTAIIVPPHCEHWWRMAQETLLIQFDHQPFRQRDFGNLSLLFGPLQTRLVTIAIGIAEARELEAKIDAVIAEETPVHGALVSAAVLGFLARLVERSRVLQGELGTGLHPAVVRAIAYVDRHVRDPITTAALSRHAYLGQGRLCQLFREQLGMTPGQYIAEAKARMAERLLLNPSMTVSDVATSLGFSSVSYFSRFFRKHCGTNPAATRRIS